ncbi:hypothetical protein [Streptomyces inhibens]|nr:hypothetical protein [Streptomyces inhibens]
MAVVDGAFVPPHHLAAAAAAAAADDDDADTLYAAPTAFPRC